jgi:hypothetical protein
MSLLLAHGADPNTRETSFVPGATTLRHSGATALIMGVSFPAAVKKLLDAGADPDVRGRMAEQH